MNYFIYILLMIFIFRLFSYLIFSYPILGLALIIFFFVFSMKKRKELYGNNIHNFHRANRSNQNSYQKSYNQSSYQNASEFDPNAYSSSYSTGKASSNDVFEAEYTEQDVKTH